MGFYQKDVSKLPLNESELFEGAIELGLHPVNRFPQITDNIMNTPKLKNIVKNQYNKAEKSLFYPSKPYLEDEDISTQIQGLIELIDSKLIAFKQNLADNQEKIRDQVGNKVFGNVKKNIGVSSNKDGSKNKLLFILHDNWSLMASMMMGIQKSVSSLINENGQLSRKDFKLQYKFELRPAEVTSMDNELESYSKSIFYDYAPYVFNEIRKLNSITPKMVGLSLNQYLSSLGTESVVNNLLKGELSSFNELISAGKSGSFFYYSANGKFILKTISKEEFTVLLDILPNYYDHLKKNPKTLMCKFYGLHKIIFKKLKGAVLLD